MKFKSNDEINKECMELLNEDKDIWKNNFHFDSPLGLINDPNGLSFYNGEYYIFFQWNPYGCEHNYKHWGYIKTKDFINFKYPNVFISPDSWYDKNGCYSGSAIVKDNILNLVYTGNVKDPEGNRESYQCLATLSNEDEVKKLGPIINEIPNGYTAHFRDPYIFEKDEKYYIVIGAQNKKLQGRALMYSSIDFNEWILEGEINSKYKDFGFMWECPSLFQINGLDILAISPQGLKKEELKYQNIYQSGYMIGNLNYENLNYNHGEFKEFDSGFDFYAPQIFKDINDRTIMIGWMGLPETEDCHITSKYGWMHSLTMPRELFIKDGILYQSPIKEFKELREEKLVCLENIETDHLNINNIESNSYEMILSLNRGESNEVNISFMKDDNGEVSLVYNFDTEICTLSRVKCNSNGIEERKFKLYIKDSLKINMFVDKSAVEIYFGDGEEVASLRIYNGDEATGLSIESKKENLKINSINIWKMGEVKYYE